MMKPSEFFAKVETCLRTTKSSSKEGVAYFIQDVEELIEEWQKVPWKEQEDHA